MHHMDYIYVPTEVFSSCLAIVSAVTVGGLFLWLALRYGTSYQTVWETRPSAETPSDVHWRRFYFQLTCVHSALELSGRCTLKIYLLTYLLTNIESCWKAHSTHRIPVCIWQHCLRRHPAPWAGRHWCRVVRRRTRSWGMVAAHSWTGGSRR